jgi:hypothetical protein
MARQKFDVREYEKADRTKATEVETEQIIVRFQERMTREKAIERAKEFMI